MNAAQATQIRMEDQRTTFSRDGAPDLVVAAGARGIAERLFRHDPPTPGEIEHAIDTVEDALAATGLRHAARGDLLARDPRLHALLGLQAAGERATRDEVEERFQRLALTALGQPGLAAGLQPGTLAAAELLILRECMHHLGFEGVVHAPPAP
jgi:hypothetical protein